MKIIQKYLLFIVTLVMGMSTAGYSQNAKPTISDSAFIAKNVKDNRMEIQLSQLGNDKGSAPVRKIARQMIFDHGKMLNDLADVAKLKNIKGIDADGTESASTYAPTGADAVVSTDTSAATATSGTATGSGTTGASGTAGAGSTNSTTTTEGGTSATSNTAASSQGAMNMAGMNNNANALNDLANATGAEFSKLWVQQMTTMHKAKLAELQAATKTITDADLLAAINKAIPKVQAHLDMLSKENTSATGSTQGSMQH